MKLAQFDPTSSASPAAVIGWYHVQDADDPGGLVYPNLPAQSDLAEVPESVWDDADGRVHGAYGVDKSKSPAEVVAMPPPSAAEQAAAAKASLLAYAVVAQAARLAEGVTVNVAASGSPAVNVLCDGTNPTRADLGLLALFGQQSPTGTKTWIDNKGVVTMLTGTQLVALATLVGTWIDDTYAALATLLGEIEAGTITTEAAIDSAFAAVTA